MNSRTLHPLVLSLEDAATWRLENVERHSISSSSGGPTREIAIALPADYEKKRRQRFPAVLVLAAQGHLGSAIEMSRLMMQTAEIRDHVLIGIEDAAGDAGGFDALSAWIVGDLLPWCRKGHRIHAGGHLLFGHGTDGAFVFHALAQGLEGFSAFAAGDPEVGAVKSGRGRVFVAARAERLAAVLPHLAAPDLDVSSQALDDAGSSERFVPALTAALRTLLTTGKPYGRNITPMRHPWVKGLVTGLSPLLSRLAPPIDTATDRRHVVPSQVLERDFEVFVSLPSSWTTSPGRRYPTLVVGDANIEFSTVAEAAAHMATAGEIDEIIVVGVGSPRAEGPTEFGFRRFEEFSPPATDYDFDDDLGRIFRSLFQMRGQDARERIGRAPQFLEFLAQELLPQLIRQLPIDSDRLGVLGHSAGGTFVAYALFQANSPFRDYLAISPGIGISGSWLMRQPGPVAARARSLFLSIGTDETRNLFNIIAGIPRTQEFGERVKGLPRLAVRYRAFDSETHSSTFPRAVVQALAATYARPDVRAPTPKETACATI